MLSEHFDGLVALLIFLYIFLLYLSLQESEDGVGEGKTLIC